MRAEGGRGHHDRHDGIERRDAGEPWLAVDEPDLSHQVAWIANTEDHFASVLVNARDLDAPPEYKHHTIVVLVLVDERCPALDVSAHAELQDRVALLLAQPREKRAGEEIGAVCPDQADT